MNFLTKNIERFLLPLATKLSANPFLKSISDGFAILLPITVMGAIFTLLANAQIPQYQAIIQSIGIKEIIGFVPKVTTEMLALYAVILISYSLAHKIGMGKYALLIGGLSLFSFLLLIPLGVLADPKDPSTLIPGVLATKWLGAAGLFSSMIVGLIVPLIYKFVIDRNWVIKMPDGVPPTIQKSFSALIPAFIIGIIMCTVRAGFAMSSFNSVNEFIYTIIQKPLTSLGASPLTFIVLILFSSLLWFFGLHGGMIVMPFISILYASASLENLEALASGQPFPNMIVEASWFLYASIGGAGGTLGLCILMAFIAKSNRYKTFGKLAIIPGVFGINEPVTFGLPIVLNTITLLPFMITPVATFLISYLAITLGLVPSLNGAQIPMGTPVLLSGWLGGGLKVLLLQALLVSIQVAIYYPFFKILDRQAIFEERDTGAGELQEAASSSEE